MSYRPSNLGYIGLASQASAKTTADTTCAIYVPYTSEDIGPEFDDVMLEEGGNGKYDVTAIKTQTRERVSFSTYARPKVAPYLYAALLGKDAPTHLTTTPFYHTITVKTTDLATTVMQPWLTVEKSIMETSGAVQRIRSVKLSNVTLEGEAGQPVTMSVEGTGLSGAVVTTQQTDTYETEEPFTFYDGTFHVNAPTTTNFDIKSCSISLSAENAEAIQTVDLDRRDIINLKVTAEITIALNYTDFTIWKKANYATGTTPSSSYSDGSITLRLAQGSGATTSRVLQVAIPKVKLAPHAVNMAAAPDVLEQPLSGVALKQSTTNLVTITAYNTIATTLPT
jgi:hypothetical protein